MFCAPCLNTELRCRDQCLVPKKGNYSLHSVGYMQSLWLSLSHARSLAGYWFLTSHCVTQWNWHLTCSSDYAEVTANGKRKWRIRERDSSKPVRTLVFLLSLITSLLKAQHWIWDSLASVFNLQCLLTGWNTGNTDTRNIRNPTAAGTSYMF